MPNRIGAGRELRASRAIDEIAHFARHRVMPGRTHSQRVTQLFADVFHSGNGFSYFGTKVTR